MNEKATVLSRWFALASACLLLHPAVLMAAPLDEGIAQYRAENIEEALAHLETARREDPRSTVAAFYLGLARKQAGDLPGAIKELESAVMLLPPVLDAYLELADAHYLSGNSNKALTYLGKAEQAGIKPGQTAFLRGLIQTADGKRDQAIASFERAKQVDPSLVQSADFQIAIALAGERKLARARDALRALIAADPTSEIATYAKEYEQSFSRLIERYRPLRLTVGLNYLYDDNPTTIPTDAGLRVLLGTPNPDHAFLGSLRLDYNPMLSGDLLFSAQYQLQNTSYGNTDTSEENPSTLINSLTLIPGYAFGTAAFSLPVNYSHVLLREVRYQQTVTARPTWSWQMAPQHILQTAFSYTRRELLRPPLTAAENRDAHTYGGSAGYIFTYGEHGGMANLRYDYSYDDAEGANWINRGHRVSLNGVVPLLPALKLTLSGEAGWQDYFKSSNRRDDTTWSGGGGLIWNLTPDVALSAQYAHTTAESTDPLYDYRRNTITAGVEVSF